MANGMPLMIVVAAALIDDDGRVLLQQRPAGKHLAGCWEFPGGKVETGETPEAALVREIAEELDITLDYAALEPLSFASEARADHHMVLLLYRVTRWQGVPRPLDAAALHWATSPSFDALALAPADRVLGQRLAARCVSPPTVA